MNGIFFFVLFGQAGADIQIKSQKMVLEFLMVFFEGFFESKRFVLKVFILHIFIRSCNDIPEN